jgi:hypothetical protein
LLKVAVRKNATVPHVSISQWLGFGVALVLLNFALSFHNVWPTLWITMRAEISMEAAALVFLLGAYGRVVRRPSNRLLAGLAGILFVFVLGRYLEVTAPALYGRAVNLYWDARYIPDVAAMLAGAAPWYLTILVVLALVALSGVVLWLLYWSLRRVRAVLDRPGPGRFLQIAAGAVAMLYFLGYYTSIPTLRWFSIPVSQTYARQVGFVIDAITGASALGSLPKVSALDGISPDALPQRDLIVTFVESYGATAFEAESVAAALETPRRNFLDAIESSGRQVASAFLSPPTFGGASWLSHASFMTGLDIREGASYDALLTQSRTTVSSLFEDAGFRTVALMPGLKNEWPEGSFYGFDAIYGESLLEYTGPEFGWWRIPDQFALARLDERELGVPGRAPLFVFFPTISTHMPFRPTPPYQPDWKRLASPEPYTARVLGDSLTYSPEWSNLRPSYAGALAYTYRYWAGYLLAHPDRDFYIVLVGDHQPPSSVSGEGARWDVPVHIITSDADVIGRLVQSGFTPGLTPSSSPVAAMHELSPLLLRSLSPSARP